MDEPLTWAFYSNNSPWFVELEQTVALYLSSTRHEKAGAEKVERSLLNADPATARRKQTLLHIGSTSAHVCTALFVLTDLKTTLSLADTAGNYYKEKKLF